MSLSEDTHPDRGEKKKILSKGKGYLTDLKDKAVQVPTEACLARLPQELDKAGNSALWLNLQATHSIGGLCRHFNFALVPLAARHAFPVWQLILILN